MFGAMPHCCRISNSVVDVTKLKEDLLLKLERERSDEVAALRSKQKQVDAETYAKTARHTKGAVVVTWTEICHDSTFCCWLGRHDFAFDGGLPGGQL